VVHGFFYEKCGSFHMTDSSIRWLLAVYPASAVPAHTSSKGT
jgi:hypothetical protein